jgi:hypothetical protein
LLLLFVYLIGCHSFSNLFCLCLRVRSLPTTCGRPQLLSICVKPNDYRRSSCSVGSWRDVGKRSATVIALAVLLIQVERTEEVMGYRYLLRYFPNSSLISFTSSA